MKTSCFRISGKHLQMPNLQVPQGNHQQRSGEIVLQMGWMPRRRLPSLQVDSLEQRLQHGSERAPGVLVEVARQAGSTEHQRDQREERALLAILLLQFHGEEIVLCCH